jgi:restriction system protein
MSLETCPVCDRSQEVAPGAPGFVCRSCRTKCIFVSCRKCHRATTFYGEALRPALVTYRCPYCNKKNTVLPEQIRALKSIVEEAARVERAAEREQKQLASAAAAEERERKRAAVESLESEVIRKNSELAAYVQALQNLLSLTLEVDDFIDFDSLKESLAAPRFDPGPLGEAKPPPTWDSFAPPQPSGVGKMMPGAKAKYEQAVAEARAAFDAAVAERAVKEEERVAALAQAQDQHRQRISGLEAETGKQHEEIDQLKARFDANDPQAIVHYFTLVLEASSYPETFPRHFRMAYVPESKQLVVEYELPPLDVVPEVSEYKLIKTRQEISEKSRPAVQRKGLYASIVSQIAVRTLHELFEADRNGKVETIVFNGYVSTTDRATGKPVAPHLVTVRTTRDSFAEIDLNKVDAEACLKGLKASVSRNPAELAPVRPVLEFNMVDPRFIEESDVLSQLDERPNLAELTPTEFESLITNLFTQMGLETKTTRPSRDGGVDCVAYDPRPIFGGKVVIQAKRYKNTVGVSAVRDLFGTVHNEGASKGILVCTSGYGKASFDFANGKPLELLDGGNLLYLLKEHADVDARIEFPENWEDPADATVEV